MPTYTNSEPDPDPDPELDDDDWSDEEDDLDSNDWLQSSLPSSESRRTAFRRAIEIAKEERELRSALDDFSEIG